jgi:hypothetical protein
MFYEQVGFVVRRPGEITNLDNAKVFKLFVNNKCMKYKNYDYLFFKLKKVIKYIVENEGEQPELLNFIEIIPNMKDDKNTLYETVSITYTVKHGLRIEQKIKPVS